MSVYKQKTSQLKDLRDYFFKYNDLIEDDFRKYLTKEVYKLDAEIKEIEISIGCTYRPFGNYNKIDFTKGGYTGDGGNDNYNCQVKQGKNLTLWERIISIV